MIETERAKLYSRDNKYLSIGINDTGVPKTSYGIPWERTVHAYNMKLPDVYITPEDLQDDVLMDKIRSFRVIGCYIWTSMDDYSFLGEFKELWDLCIVKGDAIRSLEFLAELSECSLFYLQNAKLQNLDVIVSAKQNCRTSFGCFDCVGLDNCRVEDLSSLENGQVQFSEFLVWQPEGSGEEDRWRVVRASTRKYYEFK